MYYLFYTSINIITYFYFLGVPTRAATTSQQRSPSASIQSIIFLKASTNRFFLDTLYSSRPRLPGDSNPGRRFSIIKRYNLMFIHFVGYATSA